MAAMRLIWALLPLTLTLTLSPRAGRGNKAGIRLPLQLYSGQPCAFAGMTKEKLCRMHRLAAGAQVGSARRYISLSPQAGRGGKTAQRFSVFIARSTSRLPSRSLMVARLSCVALPLARAISHLTRPFFQCRFSGTSV